MPWWCTNHPETPSSSFLNQSSIKQINAKRFRQAQKSQQIQETWNSVKVREPPTAPMRDQPTFSTQTLVQISHEGSCVKRNHLNFSHWCCFPGSALGFLSLLTPKHGRIFPPPPTKQGNDSSTSYKQLFQFAVKAVLRVHPLQCEI